MAQKDSSSFPTNFIPLGGAISLYTPPQPARGRLIILATWLAAAQKHIAKYTAAYTELIPDTRIMVIQSNIMGQFQHYSLQRRGIRPAIQPLKTILEESANEQDKSHSQDLPHILLHVFSDAGANSAIHLLQLFREELGVPLPVVGLICDSCLSKGGYNQYYNGLSHSLPKGVLSKIVGPPIVNFAILFLHVSVALGRYERPETRYRKNLINEELIRVGNPDEEGTKRICYFVSKVDQTIPWRDTLSHAKMTCENDWEVMLFVYDDTGHCNHMATHEEEYREVIKAMWTKSKL